MRTLTEFLYSSSSPAAVLVVEKKLIHITTPLITIVQVWVYSVNDAVEPAMHFQLAHDRGKMGRKK